MSVGALALTAPTAQAHTFEYDCVTTHAEVEPGAVRAVYSTERVGDDRVEYCAYFDANGKRLWRHSTDNKGFYTMKKHRPGGQVIPIVQK
jgi:hypothetical protein